MLPQSSTAISSYCGEVGGGHGPAEPLDYANFDLPVPASVYRCQPKCFINPESYPYHSKTNTASDGHVSISTWYGSWSKYPTVNLCSTIWDDYAPMLSIPEELSTMNPFGPLVEPGLDGGSTLCSFTFDRSALVYDPPSALLKTSTEAYATMRKGHHTHPVTMAVSHAHPGGIPGPSMPTMTATGKTRKTGSAGQGIRTSQNDPVETAAPGHSQSAPKDPHNSHQGGREKSHNAPARFSRSDGSLDENRESGAKHTGADPARTGR